MFPPADIRITVKPAGPVASVQATETLGDARQEAFHRSLQTLLGQSLRGEVLAKMADGSFLVKVAGSAARMMLPAGAQVGAEVPLTLVGLSPRPTFQVGAGQPGLAPALVDAEAGALLPGTTLNAALTAKASATPVGPATPAGQLPDIDPGGTPALLSVAARAISSVLNAAQVGPGTPAAILGAAALVPSPAVGPERLASALQEAVNGSGLFYESHVAQWAEGKRSLLDLMREPQMQWAQQQRAAAAPADGDARPGTDLASAQLINLQLHTHEQARVRWQGEAWPGQAMQWEIDKDAPESGRGDDTDQADEGAQPAWRSAVRFNFPLLGSVAAQLVLVGEQVHIQIHTGTAAAAESLRVRAAALEQAMAAAGSPLSTLNISQEQAAPDAHQE
jgi:hypothetical protein